MSKTANTLREFLKSSNDFNAIKFSNQKINTMDFRLLTEILKTNKTVTYLEFWGTEIGDAGSIALGEILETNNILR